jgi:hypothetical protein
MATSQIYIMGHGLYITNPIALLESSEPKTVSILTIFYSKISIRIRGTEFLPFITDFKLLCPLFYK